MSAMRRIDLGKRALLEFRGPDAVRYLNGQLTQDVRRLSGGEISLPSCVTDAKGRLQFRVTITELEAGALWVEGLANWFENLEARLTRYLIADDVEPSDLTGSWTLTHFTGIIEESPAGVISRRSNRFGVEGIDWWIPAGLDPDFQGIELMEPDVLEDLRITNRVPAWGRELTEGMLPPEALLESTDISYHKGCYIGQEVISRIKSAGKVNRQLARFSFAENVPLAPGPLENAEGRVAGEVTSISPLVHGGCRFALGYVKRGAGELFHRAADGPVSPVVIE